MARPGVGLSGSVGCRQEREGGAQAGAGEDLTDGLRNDVGPPGRTKAGMVASG
jgi:hypothetical protein